MSLFYAAGLGGSAIPDSAISRYEFEDSSDTNTAIDSWGDNNGAIDGATYDETRSAFGESSLLFDASDDDGVDVPNDGSLNPSDELSIAVWAYPTTISGGRRIFVSKGDINNDEIGIFVESDGQVAARIKIDGSRIELLGSSNLPTDEWTFFTLTFDGSESVLYEDGSSVATDSTSGSITTNTEKFQFGRDEIQTASGSDYAFDGNLDHSDLYNKGLSSSEVSDLFNNGDI
jgi:hypothetical protein